MEHISDVFGDVFVDESVHGGGQWSPEDLDEPNQKIVDGLNFTTSVLLMLAVRSRG